MYQVDPMSLVKDFLYYGVLHDRIPPACFNDLELAMHNARAEPKHVLPYVIRTLKRYNGKI